MTKTKMAFFQPIRAFLNYSGWLSKSQPSKEATFVLNT